MIQSLLENSYVVGVASALSGIVLTIVTQWILDRRGLVTYQVHHAHVGGSADDVLFGNVRVTWNGVQMRDLYMSEVQIVNQSLKDFSEVEIRIYSGKSQLLTEFSRIEGSAQIVPRSPEYAQTLSVPAGQSATDEQIKMYQRERHYFLKTFSRGQNLRFTYLNSAAGEQPFIWVEIAHPGLRLSPTRALPMLYGVPQAVAAIVGAFVGLILLACIIAIWPDSWVAASIMFVFGLFVTLPGIVVVRVWRRCRLFLGG